MQSSEEIARSGHVIPWNKGKLIGPKPPLQTKHVWAIRSKLQMESGRANLAMFNLGIDSKLRVRPRHPGRADQLCPVLSAQTGQKRA
ncbi:hypothetical protein BJ123_1117 [Rhodopseudomonas thermotolerans]|uniref:Integrase n=2 Tax=Rhodopseudomonas TaxID=1073 RepID=A0A336JSI2_9BRAD|nr:hypothetical protein BJ125_1117 [Rhodopseudomonas pentothenatexigens]REF93919.1 hypothetical protein BJ123_1117 [Rhodopseudomonas thermotolerans]SSW91246.1 hypothetical protein SAMN05892882_1117 [Rhodopseudomonas pentothenatexigens]